MKLVVAPQISCMFWAVKTLSLNRTAVAPSATEPEAMLPPVRLLSDLSSRKCGVAAKSMELPVLLKTSTHSKSLSLLLRGLYMISVINRPEVAVPLKGDCDPGLPTSSVLLIES